MKMKIQQIQKISQPKKTVQQVERAVVKYKPINAHQEHIAKDKAKKEGTRAVRLEKDDVVKLLFHAFEKHQFYRFVINYFKSYIHRILPQKSLPVLYLSFNVNMSMDIFLSLTKTINLKM